MDQIDENLIEKRFHLEKAIISASKAAYLSVLIRKEVMEIKRYKSPDEIKDLLIPHPLLNKLKKSNPEAFFYWYHTILLLS